MEECSDILEIINVRKCGIIVVLCDINEQLSEVEKNTYFL